jgi:predicted RNase H-like nuclease (RuvC/YqgF family)
LNIQDLQAEINAIDQETAQIESGVAQSIVKKLLNIIERLAGENNTLKNNLQKLSDEINRLKGEQGKPDIKAHKKNDEDISSEAERKAAEANPSGEAVGGESRRKKETSA